MKWDIKKIFTKEKIVHATHVVAKACKKHAPTALAIAACAGVAATAYLAVEAKPKADDAISDAAAEKAEQGEELTQVDILKVAIPIYGKAICSCMITIGCIIGSNRLQTKKLESIAAAYNLSQTLYSEYKDRYESVVTEDEANKSSKEIIGKIDEQNPVNSSKAKDTKRGNVLCKDFCTGQLFYSDPDYILKRIVYWNYRLQQDDVVTLDDILWDLGLESSNLGMEYGWDITRGQKVEVNLYDTGKTSDNIPYIIMKLNAHQL